MEGNVNIQGKSWLIWLGHEAGKVAWETDGD